MMVMMAMMKMMTMELGLANSSLEASNGKLININDGQPLLLAINMDMIFFHISSDGLSCSVRDHHYLSARARLESGHALGAWIWAMGLGAWVWVHGSFGHVSGRAPGAGAKGISGFQRLSIFITKTDMDTHTHNITRLVSAHWINDECDTLCNFIWTQSINGLNESGSLSSAEFRLAQVDTEGNPYNNNRYHFPLAIHKSH